MATGGEIAEVRDGEVLIERPDGTRATVIVKIRPLKNDRGVITGATNCFYDISERKRAQRLLAAQEEVVELYPKIEPRRQRLGLNTRKPDIHMNAQEVVHSHMPGSKVEGLTIPIMTALLSWVAISL